MTHRHPLPRAHTLFSAFLLVGLAPLAAQVRLEPAVRSHLGLEDGGPRPVEVNDFQFGDVDADGDLDLVVALNFRTLRMCRNDGTGVFDAGTNVGYASGMRASALGDVDGDGDLDVVGLPGYTVGYTGPDPVTINLNDGSGNFTEMSGRVPPDMQVVGRGIGLEDLDGDGDLDLLLIGEFSPLWAWENDGTGTFTDRTAAWLPPASIIFPNYFQMVDLDGNGYRDLVVVGASNLVLFNYRAGLMVDRSNLAPPTAVQTVGDFDGDGSADLLAGGGLYVNDGHGTGFTLAAPNTWLGAGPAMATADFDGDGRLDILAVSPEREPQLLLQTTPLTFVDATATWVPSHVAYRSTGTNYATAAAADIDGDGDPDGLIAGGEGRSNTSFTVGVPPKVLINAGRMKFGNATRRAMPYEHLSITTADAGDVDGDGDLDLVAVHEGFASISPEEIFFRNDGDGRFAPESGVLPAWGVGWPEIASVVRLVDVNGDGALDLVEAVGAHLIAPGGFYQNRLALNDGSGQLVDATVLSMPAVLDATASVAVGDVDGDGDPDLVFGNHDPNLVGTGAQDRLLLNDGSGVFAESVGQLPVLADCTMRVELADVDGDLDLDLVVGRSQWMCWQDPRPGVAIYLNDGSGNFTEDATRVPFVADGQALAVGDVDGDGDVDIGLSAETLVNDGLGYFTSVAATGVATEQLVLVDFDGDGSAERVTCSGSGVGVDGQSVWTGWRNMYRAVTPGDFDRDGDTDLAVFAQWTIGGISSGDTNLAAGMLTNMRRQLSAPRLLRGGFDYVLEYRATDANTTAVSLLGFPREPRLLLPGFGEFGLQATPVYALPTAVIPDPDTAATWSFPMPAHPALVGLEIAAQALFVPPDPNAAHLSNVVRDRVLP